MDDRDKRRVGEQIEPGGRAKAPGRLELVQRFVNTWNHDFPASWDRIGTPEKAASWLGAKRLVARDAPITAADVDRLRRIREAIRSLAISHHDDATPPRGAVRILDEEASRVRMAISISRGGSTSLNGAGDGIDAAVATLLAILHEAQLDGGWDRMKACRECEYLFYDRSKNRSAAWCAMAICGNRTKNRSYRRRLAAGAAG
jgi:predicted RNA-binding Zn ribbon-like protein